MKIAALGTGNMARNLLGRWAEAGHEVFFGSRDPAKARAVAAEIGHGAGGGSNDEAAAFADVVVLSARIPPRDFLSTPEVLDGKVVIDLNNHDFPRAQPVESLVPSLAEKVQAAHPKARVVKAFNTMAMEVFDHTPNDLRSHGVSAFLAGDDEQAVRQVSTLAAELGLAPVFMGGLDTSWLLEAQGDFIRTLIFKNADPMATVSTRSIPSPAAPRFGGRRKGAY